MPSWIRSTPMTHVPPCPSLAALMAVARVPHQHFLTSPQLLTPPCGEGHRPVRLPVGHSLQQLSRYLCLGRISAHVVRKEHTDDTCQTLGPGSADARQRGTPQEGGP